MAGRRGGWLRREVLSLLVGAAAVAGCVSIDYVGKTYAPTGNVDVYLSSADVTRPYEVMGEVSAQIEPLPFTSPGQQLQEKLLEAARSRGADGIVFGPLTRRQVGATQQTTGQATSKKKGDKKKTDYADTTTTTVQEVAELRGTLIKYTGP